MFQKIPPQNIEAEQGLLASCILSDPAEILDILTPEDFYKQAHMKIFTAILSLYKKKEPIDLTTLLTELKVMGCIEEVGGATYLSKLLDCPIASNNVLYAKIIKAAAVGRKIIETSITTTQSIFDSEITHNNIVDLLDTAQSEMMKIRFEVGNDKHISISDLCLKRITDYEKLCEGHEPGIKTGFRTLDLLTGGLWGSLFVIIAARPGIGKTGFMLNIAKNIASTGHKVGIFEIEMDKEKLLDRMISSLSGINSIRLRTGRIGDADWKAINQAAEKIYSLPIVIDDTGGLTIQELKRRARQMVKQGVEIIFIDQLSKIRGGKGKDIFSQNTSIVNELAEFKKELRIPICLLVQINRKAEDTKRPYLNHLKNTGAIEEDGEIILIGHREYPYTKKTEDETKANWELAKNRDGATTDIPMQWDAKTTTFFEITDNYGV
jgi:replicative DNA helicase